MSEWRTTEGRKEGRRTKGSKKERKAYKNEGTENPHTLNPNPSHTTHTTTTTSHSHNRKTNIK